MHKPLQYIISITFILCVNQTILAQSFGTFDPRSMAMGGTGVASGTSANAGYYNPALLSLAQEGYFSIEAPVFGLRYADPDDLETALDVYQAAKYEDTLATTIDTFNTSANAGEYQTNAGPVATALTNLKNGINTLSSKEIIIDANLGLVIGIPNHTVGIGIMTNTRVMGGVVLNISDADNALLDVYITELNNVAGGGGQDTLLNIYSGGDLLDPNASLSSTFNARGAVIEETGISLAKDFEIFGYPIVIGITPKSVEVTTFDYAIDLETADFDEDKGQKTYSDSNLDIGMATYLGYGVRFGVVGKNLSKKTYETVLGNQIEIKPQIRAGLSHHTRWTTFAIDADVTQNDPLGFEEKTQYIGAGIEINVFDTLQLRAGVKHNRLATVTARDKNVTSFGFGFSPLGLHVDAAYAASELEKAFAIQLGFRF